MNDLLIIIDNWNYTPDGTPVEGRLSKRIINYIEQNANIKTVVLASYSCSSELFSDTMWYTNRRKTISDYDRYVHSDYTENLNRNLQTWEGLLNYVNPGVHQIAMRNIDELTKYVKDNDVTNIYMTGVAWDICVKNRPLGYENVKKNLPNVNLLTDISCIIDSDSNTPDMTEYKYWKQVTDTMYRYEIAKLKEIEMQ